VSSVKVLLNGIMDYAGLFPPAQLPLAEALANYVRYVHEKEAWLLGRFVCPAVQLEAAAKILTELKCDQPLAFSVLGRGGRNAQEYFAQVKADLADVAHFHECLGDRASVEAYEVRLPPSAFTPLRTNQLASLVATTAFLIDTTGPIRLAPFFESPVTDSAALVAVIQALHDDQHSAEASRRSRCQIPGFKLRTGGPEPAAIPSSAQVALVLAACAAARVPFKATAGLHHPIRRFQKVVGATMHGFVNVFTAGCLAFAHGLGQAALEPIIDEENPGGFALLADGLRWQSLTATTAQIVEGRRLFTSFGSCSFDEPREDLRSLGWL